MPKKDNNFETPKRKPCQKQSTSKSKNSNRTRKTHGKSRKKNSKNFVSLIKENKEYFEARPIICNTDLVVYAGNQRLKAAKKLGMKKVPVFVMNLPDNKMQEIMIRDNVNNGEWDAEALVEFDLDSLVEYGINFTDSVMNDLIPESEEKTTKEKKSKVKKTVICENCGHEINL